jgi:putative Holliday junction resolvase
MPDQSTTDKGLSSSQCDNLQTLLQLPTLTEQQTLQSFLCFDYGLGRIGVAKGQTLIKTASPLAPLKAKDGQPNWDQVAQLVKEWQPDAFVVGLPLNMDGSLSDMGTRAIKFAKRLHGRFGKAYFLCDERLSSREAKEQVIEQQGYTDFGQHSIDGLAAQLILETFFSQLT